MRSFIARPVAIAALLAVTVPAGPVTAHEETHVEEVDATVSGSTVQVTGLAHFVDVPVVVAEDPPGDAPAAGIGLDVTSATFSRPNPASATLRLEVGVADATPQVHGAPATLYHYPVTVNGEISSCGGGTGFWFPEARIASLNPPEATPSFRLMCDLSPGAVATGPTIVGAIGGGTVSWQFSMSQIGAQAGDTISHGGDCVDPGTTLSPPGASWICNNATGDAVFLSDYVIPGATVRLGIVEAGTPIDGVALSADASIDAGAGSFAGALPAPVQAGDYVVVAEACYGEGNCGRTASETIAIA